MPRPSSLPFALHRPRDEQEMIALLASVDLDRVRPDERTRIIRWFDGFSARWDGPTFAAKHYDHTIGAYLRDARVWINDLIDGKAVEPRGLLPPPLWQLKGGRVHVSYGLGGNIYGLLAALIQQPRFPFARCPQCRRVFVRRGKQKYCSPGCKTTWTDAHRDKAARRKWMREHMRRVRARDKKKAQRRKG
jgi:hypothetical protein